MAALIGLSSLLLARLWRPDSVGEGCLITGLLVFGQITALGWLLGLLGHLRLNDILAAHLLITGASIALTERLGLAPVSYLGRLPLRAAEWVNDTVRWLWRRPLNLLAVIIAIIGLGGPLLRQLLQPTGEWDSLTYHLTFPAGWLQTGYLRPGVQPYGDMAPPFYPVNGELFFLWLMAPLKSDFLAKSGELMFALLALIALGVMLYKAGIGPRVVLPAVALLAVTPIFSGAAVGSGNDITLLCFLLTTLATFFLLEEKPDWLRAGMVFLSWSLLLGSKYIAVTYQLALFLPFGVILWRIKRGAAARQTRRLALKTLGLLGLAIGAFFAGGGLAYLRNLILVGNPLYPATVQFLGHTIFQGTGAAASFIAPWERLWGYDVGEVLVGAAGVNKIGWHLYFLVLTSMLAPALWLIRREGRMFAFAAAPLVLFTAFHFISPHHDFRFLLPAAATGIAVAALLTYREGARLERIMGLLLLGLAGLAMGLRMPRIPPAVTAVIATGLICLGAAGIVCFAAGVRRYFPRVRLALVIIVFLLLVVGAWQVCFVGQQQYLATRYEQWRPYYDGQFGPAWEWLDRETAGAPVTIAYCGNNLPYPLYGNRLQNRVVFIPQNDFAAGDYGFGQPYRDPKEARDPDAWYDNLRRAGVDYLFVAVLYPQERWPWEVHRAAARPDLFSLVYKGEKLLIFQVRKTR
jgi:hypothetical protein